MAEDEGKKEEEKIEFTPEGEPLQYIAMDQARVLAIQHARDNTAFYGSRYSRVTLVWEVLSQEETEDFYDIRFSFRPAGRYLGEPGVEQFTIDKTGNVQLRQILDEPSDLGSPERGRPRLLNPAAVGIIVIGVVALGALFGGGIIGGTEPTPVPALTIAPTPTALVPAPVVATPTPGPTATPNIVQREVVLTTTPGPTATPLVVQQQVQVVVTATPGPTALNGAHLDNQAYRDSHSETYSGSECPGECRSCLCQRSRVLQ